HLEKHERHWDFLIREFTRWSECLLKLSHRFYIVEDEINSRSKEILEQYRKLQREYDKTCRILNNAKQGVDLITQLKWNEDDDLLRKWRHACLCIQKIYRGNQSRDLVHRMKKSIPFLRYYVRKYLIRLRHKMMVREKCVPLLTKVQAHFRRHLAKKIVAARMLALCQPIAEAFNPLVRRFYYDSCWFENTVLLGWGQSALTMQRLYRGWKGRKRARRAADRRQKAEIERARKNRLAAAEREAEDLKERMRQEELARRKAEAEFALQKKQRAEARATAEKAEQERLAMEEHLRQERRREEMLARKKAEADAKAAKKRVLEERREQMRKRIAEEQKIFDERERNRKSWAKEALQEQRKLFMEKLVADRQAREAAVAAEAEARRQREDERRLKIEWMNRPWKGDDAEVAAFRDWFLQRFGGEDKWKDDGDAEEAVAASPTSPALAATGVAAPQKMSLQLQQFRVSRAFAFLDRQLEDVLPIPGFTPKLFT
ncbi:unnamed protein product, partial [Amoebophrya sp. A25]